MAMSSNPQKSLVEDGTHLNDFYAPKNKTGWASQMSGQLIQITSTGCIFIPALSCLPAFNVSFVQISHVFVALYPGTLVAACPVQQHCSSTSAPPQHNQSTLQRPGGPGFDCAALCLAAWCGSVMSDIMSENGGAPSASTTRAALLNYQHLPTLIAVLPPLSREMPQALRTGVLR
ncbi:hypothetical protein VDGL01_05870 [Verticillium dahliae]